MEKVAYYLVILDCLKLFVETTCLHPVEKPVDSVNKFMHTMKTTVFNLENFQFLAFFVFMQEII